MFKKMPRSYSIGIVSITLIIIALGISIDRSKIIEILHLPQGTCNCKNNSQLYEPEDEIGDVYNRPSQPYKNLWAFIISGNPYESPIGSSMQKDADGMYSILSGYGVLDDDIFYLKPNISSSALSLKNDGKIDSYDISRQKIEYIFNTITGLQKRNPKDKFLLFISSHGDENSLNLQPKIGTAENITFIQLKQWLNKIKCKRIYILINACESGGFVGEKSNLNVDLNNALCGTENDYIHTLSESNRIVITPCAMHEPVIPDYDGDCDENKDDRGTEFIGGFIAAFTKADADCYKNSDGKVDGKISIAEAFDYARKYAACGKGSIQTPRSCTLCYRPIIKCSKGIDLCNEFLFWDSVEKDTPEKENK